MIQLVEMNPPPRLITFMRSEILTCSYDPVGCLEATRQRGPNLILRRNGSRWVVRPTVWPHHLARHTHFPSTSLGLASPVETVQTGRRPDGSLSPGSHWLQTSWQRRWDAPFAAETACGRWDKERKKKKKGIKKWFCARMTMEQMPCV